VLGKADLDQLLAERERLNEDLQKIIDEQTEPWGVKVTTVNKYQGPSLGGPLASSGGPIRLSLPPHAYPRDQSAPQLGSRRSGFHSNAAPRSAACNSAALHEKQRFAVAHEPWLRGC
jgi:hypothetical protein